MTTNNHLTLGTGKKALLLAGTAILAFLAALATGVLHLVAADLALFVAKINAGLYSAFTSLALYFRRHTEHPNERAFLAIVTVLGLVGLVVMLVLAWNETPLVLQFIEIVLPLVGLSFYLLHRAEAKRMGVA